MDQIEIPFECDSYIDSSTIEVSINNEKIAFEISDNKIKIKQYVQFGVNLLRIHLIKTINNPIKLNDFLLNNTSIRYAFFLSFYLDADGNKTGSTWISDQISCLTIPFGNPVSWWLTECGGKFHQGLWGSKLYEEYNIFYPEPIKANQQLPQLMRDYMQYSFGFYAYRKKDLLDYMSNRKNFPYIPLHLDYNEQALLEEFERNIDIINCDLYNPPQNQYNIKDSPDLDLWHVTRIIPVTDKNSIDDWKKVVYYPEDKFPLLHKLFDWITAQNIRIDHACISQLKPMSYVAPHRDNYYKYDELKLGTEGCTQITIPIGWTPGCYLKIDNVGLMPNSPVLLNVSEFQHGSINQSDKQRFVIGIYCEHFTNKIADYFRF